MSKSSLAAKMKCLEEKGQYGSWERFLSPTHVRAVDRYFKGFIKGHSDITLNTVSSVCQEDLNWLTEGMEFLSKEKLGKLKVYGFLRLDVLKLSGELPHRLDNHELAAVCLDAWNARLKDKMLKRVLHRFSLKLDPNLYEILIQTKQSVDVVLTRAVRQTMRNYQRKYYPNERIGYAVSIHQNDAHSHAKIILFPMTDSGKLLRVTDEASKRTPFTDMCATAKGELKGYYEEQIKRSYRAISRCGRLYYQPRILAYYLIHKTSDGSKEASRCHESKAQQLFYGFRRLLSASEDELRRALKGGYSLAKVAYERLENLTSREPEKLELYVSILARKSSEAEAKLDDCYTKLAAIRHEATHESRMRRCLKSGILNRSHMRFKHIAICSGGLNCREYEVSDWMREAVKEIGDSSSLDSDSLNAYTYMLKCMDYGGDQLKRSLEVMLEENDRGLAVSFLRAQKDFVSSLMKAEIRMRSDLISKRKVCREKLFQEVRGLRTMIMAYQLGRDIAAGVGRKRKPEFLVELEHWESIKMSIPTDGLDLLGKDAEEVAVEKVCNARGDPSEARREKLLNRFRHSREAVSPIVRIQQGRLGVIKEEADTPHARKFLGTRRDGLPRVEEVHNSSAEERLFGIEERFLSEGRDGVLGYI